MPPVASDGEIGAHLEGTVRGVDAHAPHAAAVLSARFSPDGRVLATACADGMARLWDAGTGEPRRAPLPHPHYVVEAAAFTPDGRAILTAGGDGLARWWDADIGRPLGSPLRHDSATAFTSIASS